MISEVGPAIEAILWLLQSRMKEKGFTQVAVQKELGWKGSYISQLFNRTKALRVEQLLQILAVLEIDPVDFLTDAYRRLIADRKDNQSRPAVGVVLLLNQDREAKGSLPTCFLARPDFIELQGLIEKATGLARNLASATQPFNRGDQSHKSSY